MLRMQVNGDDLAGIVGGEIAHSNFHSSRGEPYVIILEFTKPKETHASGTSDHFQDIYIGFMLLLPYSVHPTGMRFKAEFIMVFGLCRACRRRS